jgi:hypothetical protein
MYLKVDSKYPNRRAYVVKLRADASPHVLTGRVENLVSGRQREFASASDLIDSLSRDLLESANELPLDESGDSK